MSTNCITDTSKSCFKPCCANSLRGPDLHPSSPNSNPRQDFKTAMLSSIQPNTSFTNHESLPSLTQLFSTLINAFPQYLTTVFADDIRAKEYHHLSNSNHVCLDYIGNGLFSHSQLQNCNPTVDIVSSSTSSTSSSSIYTPFFSVSYKSVDLNTYISCHGEESEFETTMRKRIMRYMNLFEEDYYLVFTANQSSALKLVADSYPFKSNQNILTVYDYENESVQALIETAKERGARTLSALFSWPSFRINFRKLRKFLVTKNKQKNSGLFVFPLQSRMTGSRYSHQCLNLARDNGWHVLLDASALGAKDMETLGLSLFQPDFIISSFFKIFGENPSGFCCLFIKKSSIPDLSMSSKSMGIISLKPEKNAFGKSNVDEAIQQTPSSSKSQQPNEETVEGQEIEEVSIKQETSLPERVEMDENSEATQFRNKKNDILNRTKLEFQGLDHADTLGLILISRRCRILINWLVNALLSLTHPHSGNGFPLVRIYGPKIKLERGPAIAFNVYDWKGEKVDPVLVQKLADRNNISVSCGFLRNIWFSKDLQAEKEIVLENKRVLQGFKAEEEKKKKKKKGKRDCGIEVVSVFVGMLSNFEDVYRVWAFVSRFLDADFVEKERWRYVALNHTPIEV